MKNILLLGAMLLFLTVGAIFFFGQTATSASNAISPDTPGNVQKIVLGIKNNNYYPNTITVKAGEPVSLTLDSSVQGCLRSFNIDDLNVHALSRNPAQTIDFTPTKKGTFRFACSMNMGYGTIIVE